MTPSILWLARTLPLPLNAGDRIYSAHLAGAVARQGAHVVFLGLQNPDDTAGSIADLEPRVRWTFVPGAPNPPLISLASRLPMVGARFSTRAYRDAIARELRQTDFEAVVLDQYGMSWAISHIRKVARRPPILIHVSHDFETRVTDQIARNFAGDPIRQFLLKRNAGKTAVAETDLARSSRLVVTLTEEDRNSFAEINPSLRCVVLPPGHAGRRAPPRVIGDTVPRRAVIVGSFSWIAKQINLERMLQAAQDIFPPTSIELHVVGVIPEPLLSRLRERFPWVEFRGFVDDLGEELRHARVALVPEEIGGGFKLKILDYIFARVPVAAVAPALGGIPVRLKDLFLIEDDVAALLQTVAETIDDVDCLNRMQTAAFDIADGLFDWDINGQRLLEGLRQITREISPTEPNNVQTARTVPAQSV
ncbi:glycosyltransferase family 4 protein [Bradyrhizobium sp. HKCCYLS2038]|uniref:glycosyltransferase family 4 protein n=1 Tax=unclassified Bradyrhizobium TaxID=2631580 RepID=UPI003EBCE8F4